MVETGNEKTSPSVTIDAEGLRRFLRERKLGEADDLYVENISFGHSNEVHLVDFEGKSWALRRPPRGPLLPTAHDVMREFRVLNALQNTPVPVPRVFAGCDDSSYIGAPFFLMEYMRGKVIRSALMPISEPSFAVTETQRRAISEQIIDLLVALQAVDWRAVGLEGFGRPDGYVERQVRRWSDQLERTLPKTRPLPVMAKIQQWLTAHLPPPQPATIVHGDYKLDNVMWDPSGARPRPIALFDWEMSTLGDPLADLGWLVSYWSDPADDEKRRAVVSSMEAGGGYYNREEMIALYERKSGRAMRGFAFYEVFSLFKLAIIGEGSYARYLGGQADDPVFATYDLRIPQMAEVAWSLCEKAG
ncbi:MAG TPA: phosphotransferase family protein [Candidatus Binataceae bacterium]|nr:phosphotransferase family protein [Candidatus Binataceae bacterium]